MKKLFSLALIATSVALLSACSPDEDNKVKVAINTGPDEAIWKVVEQVIGLRDSRSHPESPVP